MAAFFRLEILLYLFDLFDERTGSLPRADRLSNVLSLAPCRLPFVRSFLLALAGKGSMIVPSCLARPETHE